MHSTPTLADPALLLHRAAALVEAGRTGAAKPLLAALRVLPVPEGDLARLAARLAIRERRFDDARSELDAAIAIDAANTSLRKLRAEVRMELGDAGGAAADAAEAVVLDGEDPGGKALLGAALLQLGRPEDARACLDEAVRAEPAVPPYRQALAMAAEACGDAAAAAAALREGIAACPGAVELRNAAVLLAVRRQDEAEAVTLARTAQRDGAADACTFGLLGHALSRLGRHEDAGEAYGEALKLGPNDPYVQHLVAASGARRGADRAPAAYLRAVFDGYAERFETHLIALGYRVPGLLRAALLRQMPTVRAGEPAGPVLDLGCGTGLVAVACSDLPLGPWVGVDVSSRMLAEAGRKALYAELREADLVAALAAETRSFPLIVAGDVFCYFGALDPVLALARERLAPGGLLIFSVEEHAPPPGSTDDPGAPWILGAHGRYAHAPAYVRDAASRAGLEVRECTAEALRNELGTPVPGRLVVLARPQPSP